MYDELKANVFSKLPKRILQMSVCVREMKLLYFPSPFRLPFHPHVFENLAYFFYTRVELKLPKKKKRMYAKHSVILSVQFAAGQP